MSHFTLRREVSKRRAFHVIVDANGVQYGPTFGDVTAEREARPWLQALEQAFVAGKVERDMELRPSIPTIIEESK